MTVFPLYLDGVLYGAIQQGEHDFYIRETGKPDVATSSARFTSVWLLQDDSSWKLAEALSYDHHDP